MNMDIACTHKHLKNAAKGRTNQGKSTEKTAGCVRPEGLNKWPNYITAK